MRKFYISTFLASILLITSCTEDAAPAPATSPCTPVSVSFAPGEPVYYTSSDGRVISGVAPEEGLRINDCVSQ